MNIRSITKYICSASVVAALLCVPCAYGMEAEYGVEYVGGAERFAQVDQNMFGHVLEIMPGDVLHADIVISNFQDVPVEVFVSAKETVIDGPKDALDRMDCTLTGYDGTIIHEGPLAKIGDMEAVSLGIYGRDETSRVSYEIVIPDDLGNEYSGMSLDTDLVFSVEERPIVTIEDDGTPLSDLAGIGKTGDESLLIGIALLCAACLGFILIGMAIYRERSRRLGNVEIRESKNTKEGR